MKAEMRPLSPEKVSGLQTLMSQGGRVRGPRDARCGQRVRNNEQESGVCSSDTQQQKELLPPGGGWRPISNTPGNKALLSQKQPLGMPEPIIRST